MKKPYENSEVPTLFKHPKVQIDGRINQLERLIEERKNEISIITQDLNSYEDELAIWKEIINIIRTYEVTDEVRERLIQTKTYIIEPNP